MSEIAFEKLKYVAVEIIKKAADSVADVECGLFMGICRRLDSNKSPIHFIVIKSEEDTAKLYNIKEFNILTVDILSNDTRYMTVFTNSEEDQLAACTILHAAKDQLEEENRLQEVDLRKELIDIDTYKEYPKSILNSNNLSNTSTVKKPASVNYSRPVHKPMSSTVKFEKKEPAVLHFKRKGKLPSSNKLEEMRTRVMTITTGEFDIKSIPIPKCDLEEEVSS